MRKGRVPLVTQRNSLPLYMRIRIQAVWFAIEARFMELNVLAAHVYDARTYRRIIVMPAQSYSQQPNIAFYTQGKRSRPHKMRTHTNHFGNVSHAFHSLYSLAASNNVKQKRSISRIVVGIFIGGIEMCWNEDFFISRSRSFTALFMFHIVHSLWLTFESSRRSSQVMLNFAACIFVVRLAICSLIVGRIVNTYDSTRYTFTFFFSPKKKQFLWCCSVAEKDSPNSFNFSLHFLPFLFARRPIERNNVRL